MWRATIKGVLARKIRLLLTALAVVLGVTFASGTYVLTDTLKQSFGSLFSQFAAGTDLVVRSRAPFGDGEGTRERLASPLVTEVRKVPGVRAADGFLQGYAQFVERDGKTAIQTGGAPTFGISWSGGGNAVGPARVAVGRRPVRDGEVAMDAGTARRYGYRVGDTVKVLGAGPAEEFQIVGLMKIGDREDFGAVSFAAFDPLTAQRVFAAPGLYDAINVRIDKGADVQTVRRSLRAAIGPGYEVQVSQFVANETRKPIDEFLTALNQALLGFAGVGVLVGGFIIFNTFTILISQRTRELGLLRAMGASGTQVVGSVLIEAGIVGVVASLLGFALGIALASFLLWLLPQIGFPVPGGPLVVLGRTLFAAAVVGVGMTMLAAVFPAVRAARTPPIAAIGDLRITRAGTRFVRRLVLAVIVFAVGITVGLYGVYGDLDPSNAVAIAFIGGFVIFVGLVVIGPLFMRRLSGGIGRPLPAALGITGSLARSNAMRNPRRTNATAAALVVGLGLVALVAIFAASLKASVRSALDDVRADYVITASQFAGFSPEVSTRVRATPGVQSAVSFRFGDAQVGKSTETINGTSARGINDVLNLRFVSGSADALNRGGLLLSEKEATSYHRRVGDTLGVGFPRTGVQNLPVIGIYKTRRFSGAFPIDFIVSKPVFEKGFGGTQQDTLLYVKAAPGQADAVGRRLDRRLAGPFPNVTVKTRDEYLATRLDTVDQFLNVFIALLLLSEVIAVLGIVNTLMLSVYERTRELGLLRTVGTTRRQIWSMVCGESVIIAVIGCVLGVGVGIMWGWAVTTALRGQFVDRFEIPPVQLAWFLVASVIAGLIAALLPAWHASRLNVLEAIAQE